MTNEKKFRKWVRWMRKRFPPPCRTTVKLVEQSQIDCSVFARSKQILDKNDKQRAYIIYISKSANEDQTLESLWEEWAHAITISLNLDIYSETDDEHEKYKQEHDEIYGAFFNMMKKVWFDPKLGFTMRKGNNET